MIVVLVGCGSAKANHRSPAKDLYTGSLFRAARSYAEKYGTEWAILSALHGLVDPEQEVDPYDVAMSNLGAAQRRVWGVRVRAALRLRWPRARFVLLAGRAYRDALGVVCHEPLQGLRMGERIAWLRRRV